MIAPKRKRSLTKKTSSLKAQAIDPRTAKIEAYVKNRFDANYLRDFKKVWRTSPQRALDLLKKWEDF